MPKKPKAKQYIKGTVEKIWIGEEDFGFKGMTAKKAQCQIVGDNGKIYIGIVPVTVLHAEVGDTIALFASVIKYEGVYRFTNPSAAVIYRQVQ